MANQKPAKNLPKCQFVSMVYSIPSAPGVPCEVRCLGTKTPLQQTTCRSRVPLEHKGMFTSSLHPSKKPTKKTSTAQKLPPPCMAKGMAIARWPTSPRPPNPPFAKGWLFSKRRPLCFFFGGETGKNRKSTEDSKFMLGLDCLVAFAFFFANLYGLYCMIMHAEIV